MKGNPGASYINNSTSRVTTMEYSRWLLSQIPLWTLIAVLLCRPVFAGDPPDHTGSGERPLDEFLTENGTFQNPDGYSGTLNPAGFSLSFNEGGTPVFVDNSSSDSNDNWNTVGEEELSAIVYALFIHNNILYVGGDFKSVGGIAASHIARYDINTQTWGSLGDGVDGFVNCFAILGDFLYVGGGFWQAGGKSARQIARYNLKEDKGNSSWSGFGHVYRYLEDENDWFPSINVMIIKENTLIVGGRFTSVSGQGYSTNGSAVNSIARFDTITQTWSPFGDGIELDYDEYGRIDGDVNGLTIIDDYLYASGYSLEYAGGNEVNNIARYNLSEDNGNSSWNALPGEDPGRVKGMVAKENNLVIAGSFENYGDLGSDNIGLYNTVSESWYIIDGDIDWPIYEIGLMENILFIGGYISSAGGKSINNIASLDLDSEEWETLGDGVNSAVRAFAASGNDLYVGGDFTQAGGKPASYLARWSGVPIVPPKLVHFVPENNSSGVSVRPELDWQHHEQADSYELVVSESEDFSDPVIYEPALDPSSHQVSQDLEYNTTYYWRVRGSNENGSGPWSDPWNFTTATGPAPDKVVLQSPEDTAAEIPLQPTLTWEPADEAEEYRLELSDTPDFSDPMIHQEDIEATSFQITENLQYGQTYYWRVRGVNTFGKGPWSDSRSFTTVNSPVPEKVILLSPENNSNKIQLRPELAWNQADESNSYELLLSENQDLSNPFLHQTDLQETSFQLAQDLDYNKIYYWRVRGGNDSGDGPWSETWNFTTVALPDHVTLKSPENNALDIPLQPELSWMAADETESYELEISESSDLSNPFLHPTNISGTSFQITDDLDYDKTYFWHVRGINSNGNGPWSETWIFSTIPPPMPAQVVLVSPGNNGTNIPLQPELTWETAGETESYELILSEEPDLSMPLLHMTDLQETNLQVDEDLQYNQTYYWQVRGINMYGEGSWSEIWSFTTTTPSVMALDPNWPNPFSKTTSGTTIRYRIPVESKVRMEIYDLSGKRVAILVDRVMTAGQHDVTFDGSGLADGLYFYRLGTGNKSITRKMMLIN